MDRSHSFAPHRPTAVRAAGCAALELLLSAAAGERGELASAARARRVVPEAAVFRQPQNGRRVRCGPPSRSAADADFGDRSSLPQTALESSGTGSPSVSVLASRWRQRKAQTRLENRYYLHSDARWFSVPSRGDGLVQPLRTQLGTFQYPGDRLLPGG